MVSLNKYQVIGRLTYDPEIRSTPSGKKVASIRVVHNTRRKDRNGEKIEEALFLDAEAWDNTAEWAATNLKKGDVVYIEGALKMDNWDDKKTGEKRSKIKIIAYTVQKDWGNSPKREETAETPAAPAGPSAPSPEVDEDEVPF